jgi:hypothetical protein
MSGTSPTVAANPWTQRASEPPSTPTTQAGAPSFSFSLRAASKFRALMPAPESSTNRSGLLVETALTFRQISPSRNSNGISAPGFAQADNCEKTAVSGSRRNQKNARAFCNASGGISTRCATIRACWINGTPNFRRRVLIAIMMDWNEQEADSLNQGPSSIFCCSSPSRGWSLARRHRSRAVIATQSDRRFAGTSSISPGSAPSATHGPGDFHLFPRGPVES